MFFFVLLTVIACVDSVVRVNGIVEIKYKKYFYIIKKQNKLYKTS